MPGPGFLRRHESSLLLVGAAEPELHSWLTAAGYETRATATPKQALKALADAPAQLILVGGGDDAAAGCRVLRDDARLGEAWLLAVTDRDDNRTSVEALQAGADDYVQRPFSRTELLARTRAGVRAAQQRSDDSRRSRSWPLPSTSISPARQCKSSSSSRDTSTARRPSRASRMRIAKSRAPTRLDRSHDPSSRSISGRDGTRGRSASRQRATDGTERASCGSVSPRRLRKRSSERMADTWIINPHATSSTIARQLELFHRVRQELGRPPLAELPAIKEVVCAPTRRRALEIAKPYLTAKYEAYRAWGQDAALPADETFDLPFEQLLQDRFVIGTPDDCLRELLGWRDDLGVDHFLFRPFWSGMPVETALESMELLSREVVPALRQR